MRYGSGLSKGLCLICENNQNSLNDSPSISKNSSQSPPHINHHCCYECGDPLDGIFCKRCTCKSCGKGAHIGYNCPPKVSGISNPEPCKNQTIDELPQTLPSFHPTCYSGDESPFTCDSTPNIVDDCPNDFNPPPQPSKYSYEFCGNDAYYGHDCPPQIPICYDDDEDYTIAITYKEPDNSLRIRDEHLDTISATESDEFINSSVENLVPNPSESKGEHECDVPACDDFTTFFNLLFDADDDFSSNPHHFNHESDLIESLINQDSSIISSSLKIDYLLDEFAGELILLKSIPPGIDKADYDPEEEIHLIKKLLYDNSSPRSTEEFNSKNSDAIIESFSPSPIPAEDIDPFMKEIDLLLASDGSIPPDEFIKSSVENLVPNPSESKGEHECDVPACDDFTTFFNLLFDADDDFSSSDDESFSDEDISKKIYSNPLFDEEIISMKIDPHHFNVESDLIESLINQDSSIISSSLKIDYLLDEFADELILLKSIPPRIYKADCDPEEEICLIEKLLYDNSSPRPLEEFNSKNSDAIIESFSPSPIPAEDSDPFIEEIDLFLASDGSIPPGIDNDYSDSEWDNLFLERLLHDDPIPLRDTLDFSNVVRVFFPSSLIR
nr:hypothetical protein [Tanacetum cinerariifolium]